MIAAPAAAPTARMPATPAAEMPLELSRGEGAGWCMDIVVVVVVMLRRRRSSGPSIPGKGPGRRATVKRSWALAMLPGTGAAVATL